MAANNVVVGVRDREGNRLDVPSADGTQLPVVLRLGEGLAGAPEVVDGEKQVLLVVPTQLRASGQGLTGSVPAKELILEHNIESRSYDQATQTLHLGGLLEFTNFDGSISAQAQRVQIGSNLACGYDASTKTWGIAALPAGSPEVGTANTVYWSNGLANSWESYPTIGGVVYHPSSGNNHTTKLANDMIVDQSGTSSTVGSYAISAKPYDLNTSQVPRKAKFYGSFRLSGQWAVKALSFPTSIDGAAMPASSVLIGTFTFGWCRMYGSNPYQSGAISFLVDLTSDDTGTPLELRTGLSGSNYATQSAAHTFTVNSSDLESSMSVLDGDLPCAISIALSGTNFLIEFGTMGLVSETDLFKFYWEFSYGWGTS